MSELSSSPNLEPLFQCSNSTRQRNKSIGKVGHQGFPFVHRICKTKVLQSPVSYLLVDKRLRNYPDNLPSFSKHCLPLDRQRLPRKVGKEILTAS